MSSSPTALQGPAKHCADCGLVADVGRYCEACGGDLIEHERPAATAAWLSSAATEDNPERSGGSDDHAAFTLPGIGAATYYDNNTYGPGRAQAIWATTPEARDRLINLLEISDIDVSRLKTGDNDSSDES